MMKCIMHITIEKHIKNEKIMAFLLLKNSGGAYIRMDNRTNMCNKTTIPMRIVIANSNLSIKIFLQMANRFCQNRIYV